MVGWWSVKGGTGNYRVAAGLLVIGTGHHEQLRQWIELGRQRGIQTDARRLGCSAALAASVRASR